MDRIKSFIPSRHGYTRSRVDSDLSFVDARPPNFSVPLSPPPGQLLNAIASGAGPPRAGPSAGLSVVRAEPVRMNASEQKRLQGLMRREQRDSLLSVGGSSLGSGADWAATGSKTEKLKVWMVNEGEYPIPPDRLMQS